MILPKKITSQSNLHLVHTSSPVSRADWRSFEAALKKLSGMFPNLRIYDVARSELDPRYLSASEDERLRKFRRAIKKVDWLAPIYGGTGCGDIIRRLNKEDLADLKRNRPVVNGFSDTTFLINFLYFKLRLLTFYYTNARGLFDFDNSNLFFEIIFGKKESYSFREPNYRWLTDAGAPEKDIEGIAIGGNLQTFRDLLDICKIKPRSWEDYILFIEEVGEDIENIHRIIIALDERGVFRHIKALVIGKMDEKEFGINLNKFNFIFGKKDGGEGYIFEYLLSGVIQERFEKNDPLYILKIENLGHGLEKNALIIPIGGKTIIHPNKTIEFQGPFVA